MIQEQERMRIAINRNGRTPYRHELKTLVAAAAAPLDELPGNKQSIALSNLFSTSSAISIALCVAPPPTPLPPPPLKLLL